MLAGRYELAEELGAGGMGRVVVAHDHVLGRDVAIKLLTPSADPTARERFIREARSAARLHHPNVVSVFDTGEEDGQPYLVMELVRGRSLADVLRSEGALDVDEAVAITLGVLEGLAAAHRSGMVHRDIKPANVMLPEEGGVKISDFGIAKAVDDVDVELTAIGSLMGTPTYLAPELVGGEAPSASSDVYSVGCLLYAQLTGDPPFTEGEPLAIAYAHANQSVRPVEEVRPDVPPEVATVVARALEKDPAARYESALAMRTALLDGPEPAPLTGDDTVAMAGVGAGAGAAADANGTQVMDYSDDEATRAIGSAGAAPAAAPPAPRPAADRGRRRRWWVPVLVAVAVLAAALLLWPLLTGAPGDGELLDDEPEDTDEVEEAPEEPEPEVDEAPEAPEEAPPEEEPEPPEEEPEPPPADEPEEEEPPVDPEELLEGEEEAPDEGAGGAEAGGDEETASDTDETDDGADA
jgi:eukaryotic-like serine/threonine-protein kinase